MKGRDDEEEKKPRLSCTNKSVVRREKRTKGEVVDRQTNSVACENRSCFDAVSFQLDSNTGGSRTRKREGDALTAFDGSAASVIC